MRLLKPADFALLIVEENHVRIRRMRFFGMRVTFLIRGHGLRIAHEVRWQCQRPFLDIQLNICNYPVLIQCLQQVIMLGLWI